MSRWKKRRPLLVLLLAILILWGWEQVFGPQTPEDPSPQDGGVLQMAFSMPILSLDPYGVSYGSQGLIYPLIYSFLIVPGVDGGFAPDLAMRWWADDDERQWTFILRPEARFHDGRPVTSADVAYSLERIRLVDPGLDQAIDSVDSSRPQRVVVRLKHRLPHLLYQLSVECIVPRPLSDNRDQDRFPVGSGPFKVAYRDRDQRVLLEAFPEYFASRPHLDAIDIQYMPDGEKIWIDFMNGRIQACYGVSPENVHFMRLEPGYYRLEGELARSALVLLFNTRLPLFEDVRVRRALARMLDLEGHVRRDLRGLAETCPGPLGRLSPYLPPDASTVPYDPDAALADLADAGWKDEDGDGYLEKDGRRFEFDLLIPMTLQTERETGSYIQRALNQFGIRVRLVFKRYDRMIDENLRTGGFQACLTEHSANPHLITRLAAYWSSSGLGIGNVSGYASDEVDRLLERLMSLERDEDLGEPLRRFNARLLADQPAVWLYHKYEIHAFSRRVLGMNRPDPDYFLTFPLRGAWLAPRRDLAH